MNKYQEALNSLVQDATYVYRKGTDLKESLAVKTLQELVGKTIPKKPLKREYGFAFRNTCPTCSVILIARNEFIKGDYGYCDCGQMIDWSQSND